MKSSRLILSSLLALSAVGCTLVLASQPEEPVSIEKAPTVSVEAPSRVDDTAGDVVSPVLSRPSATRLYVTGASYVRISPRAQVLDGFGEPIEMADMVVPMNDETPIVFVVDPDTDYEVYSAVRFLLPDQGDGLDRYSTEYFSLSSVSERIDQIQALLLMMIEVADRREDLGDISFMDLVDALERLHSSGDLSVGQSARERALEDQ